MRVLVTGSEGFVGTNLCKALASAGYFCWKIDEKRDNVHRLRERMRESDAVIHLAANADVRFGWDDPARDVERNTVATARLLEDMRATGCKRLLFASSSSVYGNAPTPTPETYAGQQTSLYGASKLAGEGLIGAYCEAGFLSATVLRLTSMLGPHYRHGLVKDFVDKFRESPELELLGDGGTPRTRFHVEDGCAAFLSRLEHDPGFEVYNVGSDETITSRGVAELVAAAMGIDPVLTVKGSSWAGDHPILLDCTRLRETGWAPRWSLADAVRDTVAWLT